MNYSSGRAFSAAGLRPSKRWFDSRWGHGCLLDVFVISYHIIYHIISYHVIWYISYIVLYHVISYIISYISCQVISYIMSYHISYHIYHVKSYHIYHIISYHVKLCHTIYVMSSRVISYHIISYHIMILFFSEMLVKISDLFSQRRNQ
jgi:hypothetical protein